MFRIIVSGDSVTMGWSVTEEAAYPSRTESLLHTADDDRTYEVLNLGLAQLNLRQIVDRLEEVGLQFNPDLIVYGFTLNDVMGKGYRFSHLPEGIWGGATPRGQSVPVLPPAAAGTRSLRTPSRINGKGPAR